MSGQKVPLIDLQAQFAPLRDGVLDAIARVCDTQHFILGPEVEALERELEAFLGIPHAIGVSSGTDALARRLDGPRRWSGRRGRDDPVFVLRDGGLDRSSWEPVRCLSTSIPPRSTSTPEPSRPRSRRRRKRSCRCTCSARAPTWRRLSTSPREPAFPSSKTRRRRSARCYRASAGGGIGAIGCFSFFPTKNLGAFGDAGLVTTSQDGLARRLRSIRQHGGEVKYHHDVVGANFRLDALQAAVLRVKLPHLE